MSGLSRGLALEKKFRAAFTLLELLVSTVVLALLLTIILSVTSHASSAIRRATAKTDSFQAARTAFDLIQQRLSQATLNTYWDYYDGSGNRRTPANSSTFVPASYGRASDLHFLVLSNGVNGQAVFFQCPEALSRNVGFDQTQGLMNACGYFVEFGSDAAGGGRDWHRPGHVPSPRYRYRLMQAIEPSEDLSVFTDNSRDWATEVKKVAWPVADNVIALIVWPRLPTAEGNARVSSDYLYDSRDGSGLQKAQMPPVVQVTMIIIDEASAVRLESGVTPPAAITSALQGRFGNVMDYQSDLNAVERALADANINFTILNGAMAMKESRWSSTP